MKGESQIQMLQSSSRERRDLGLLVQGIPCSQVACSMVWKGSGRVSSVLQTTGPAQKVTVREPEGAHTQDPLSFKAHLVAVVVFSWRPHALAEQSSYYTAEACCSKEECEPGVV